MAETNYTKIIAYHSETPAAIPDPADMEIGELAINIADGLIFSKNTAGEIVQLGGASDLGTMSLQDADDVDITGGSVVAETLRSSGRILNQKQTISISAGAATIDLATGDSFIINVTENVVITLANYSATYAQFSYLEMTNAGAYTVTFSSTAVVQWVGSAQPTFTTSGKDGVAIIANDGASITLAAALDIGAP